MDNFLKKEKTGLWLIDVQENLFHLMDRSDKVLETICFVIKATQLLKLPIFVTEQYPTGLGGTVAVVKKLLPEGQVIYPKTFFSGYRECGIREAVNETGMEAWILVGIEAHICVLQTAKDLLEAKKDVIILKDAISSRSAFDFSIAIAEMNKSGARISSSETIVYEMIRDAATPEFKALLPLVKAHA
jgi:nicotinamidase-related amidase